MRLFLQINISDWKDLGYQSPLTNYASSLSDDIIGTDLDYQSEPYVAELILKLASEAEAIFVYVYANNAELPLGTALTVLNQLFRTREKIQLAILHGENGTALKMLKPLQERFKTTVDEKTVKEEIKKFALRTY